VILIKKKKKIRVVLFENMWVENWEFRWDFRDIMRFFLRIYVVFDVLAPTTPHNHDEYPPKT